MCENCYKDAGEPHTDTEKVRHAVDLMHQAERYNDELDIGSGMYGVVSNWNVKDSSVQWCLDNQDLNDFERELCELMLTMSLDERYTAMAIDHHFIKI